MKNLLTKFVVFLFVASFISCGEDYSSPLKGQTVEDVVFEAASFGNASKTISFGNEDLSKCVLTYNSNWCDVTIQGSSIVISVQNNGTYEERQAIITITDPEDGTTLSFKVVQQQNNAIIVDGEKFEIPEEGGEIIVKVQSNVNYNVDIPTNATWLTKVSSSTRGLSNSTIKLKADKNNSGDIREAVVKLSDSASGTTSQITVKQKLTPVVAIDKEEVTIDEFGGDFNIAISSNIPLDIKSDADWVVLGDKTSTGDFSFDQKVKVKALPGSTNSRSASIIVTDKDGKWELRKVVSIKQNLSLSIQSDDFEIYEGESYTIKLINNTGKTVSWKSSNNSVATVDSSGKVTGVGKGTAKITVSSADGKYSDQVTVTVKYYDITSYISASTSAGLTSIVSSSGSFYGYFVSSTIKNGSNKSITVNKCTIYEGGSLLGTETDFGTAKAGGTKSVSVRNAYIDITTRSYKFVWEYSYNGKTYTYTSNYR